MIILFILGLVVGAVAVIFTLQNTEIITVVFFGYKFTGSLSTVVTLSILSGILISLLMVFPESLKNYFRYNKLKKTNRKLEEELKKQKELTVFAKEVPPTPQDIKKIEDGVIEEHIL